ncbi:MAG: hypothetical protein IPK17_17615 [Chloroflexi bacterium]|uniref:SWIM zinc finger family protein n=1 Tax=Candidatus Flexifilum breve TaxID=3140694 RepID=UPI0031351FCB|nr:hypothetical protein [Chloroflexota bacterium]
MSLTFANFKQVIPSQILTRGREYLRQGQILDLSFDEEELIWEAQVEGTDLYDVRIELVVNGSLNTSCTRPMIWVNSASMLLLCFTLSKTLSPINWERDRARNPQNGRRVTTSCVSASKRPPASS